MKRVLVTATTYPLSAGDTQPRFIHELCKSLVETYDLTVLVPRGSFAKDEELFDSVPVKRYAYFIQRFETLVYGGGILENLKNNRWNYLLVPFLLIAQFFATLRCIREKNIQIVNAHWIIPQGLIAVLIRKLLGSSIQVIITSHGGDLYGLKGRLANRIKRWVIEQSDCLLVVSSSMRDYCYEILGVKKTHPIIVRSMGVDLENTFVNYTDIFQRKGLVFVGRLAEKKGLPVLLKAIHILNSESVSVKLTVVGGGLQLEQLKTLVKAYEIEDQVTFLGPKNHKEIPEILNRHQIFVMPSVVSVSGDQEGLGLVAVEAMGCGCAVVASDLPALYDVISDDVDGLMFKAGSAEDLAKRLRLLTEDKEVLERLARNGNASVLKRFDWSKVALDYVKVFEGVATGAS